jgi:predicted ester cyclase
MTRVEVARGFHQAYRDGDVAGFLDCLAPAWVVHESDGSTSSSADLADIIRLHAQSFPEKTLSFLHEVEQGDLIAQFVRYSFVHTGRYLDLEPTGLTIEFFEMIFHRFLGDRIAESWRLTYPLSMSSALTGQRNGFPPAD